MRCPANCVSMCLHGRLSITSAPTVWICAAPRTGSIRAAVGLSKPPTNGVSGSGCSILSDATTSLGSSCPIVHFRFSVSALTATAPTEVDPSCPCATSLSLMPAASRTALFRLYSLHWHLLGAVCAGLRPRHTVVPGFDPTHGFDVVVVVVVVVVAFHGSTAIVNR